MSIAPPNINIEVLITTVQLMSGRFPVIAELAAITPPSNSKFIHQSGAETAIKQGVKYSDYHFVTEPVAKQFLVPVNWFSKLSHSYFLAIPQQTDKFLVA